MHFWTDVLHDCIELADELQRWWPQLRFCSQFKSSSIKLTFVSFWFRFAGSMFFYLMDIISTVYQKQGVWIVVITFGYRWCTSSKLVCFCFCFAFYTERPLFNKTLFEVPCHRKCDTIIIPPCSKAVKFCIRSPVTWRLLLRVR